MTRQLVCLVPSRPFPSFAFTALASRNTVFVRLNELCKVLYVPALASRSLLISKKGTMQDIAQFVQLAQTLCYDLARAPADKEVMTRVRNLQRDDAFVQELP